MTPVLSVPTFSEERFVEWQEVLRQLRIEVRATAQQFVGKGATIEELATMRVQVCDVVTEHLRTILKSYWGQGECDFFFSPGYRPFGDKRMVLDPQDKSKEIWWQNLDQLGRSSERNPKYFSLATWMRYIYEETVTEINGFRTKVGGFTDWFSSFDHITIKKEADSGSPLVAFVIRNALNGDSALQAHGGVARFTVGSRPNTTARDFLDNFTTLLTNQYECFEFYGQAQYRTSALEISEFIPYPPVTIYPVNDSANGRKVRILSGVDMVYDDNGERLSGEHKVVVQQSLNRFAELFWSIFNVPPALPVMGEDATIETCRREIKRVYSISPEFVAYEYYHVFVTDQDLAAEDWLLGAQSISAKMGTLNLYTHQPLCEVALGLIRDALESVYNTVRDAEILTEGQRVALHPDPVCAAWIRKYVSPWTEKRLPPHVAEKPWNHNLVNETNDLVKEGVEALLPGATKEEIDLALRWLFLTKYVDGTMTPIASSPINKELSEEMLSSVVKWLKLSDVTDKIDYELFDNRWNAPCTPQIRLFLALRNLLWFAANDPSAREDIHARVANLKFCSSKAVCSIIVLFDVNKLDSSRGWGDRGWNHEVRYRIKEKQNALDDSGLSTCIRDVTQCKVAVRQHVGKGAGFLSNPARGGLDVNLEFRKYAVEWTWKILS